MPMCPQRQNRLTYVGHFCGSFVNARRLSSLNEFGNVMRHPTAKGIDGSIKTLFCHDFFAQGRDGVRAFGLYRQI